MGVSNVCDIKVLDTIAILQYSMVQHSTVVTINTAKVINSYSDEHYSGTSYLVFIFQSISYNVVGSLRKL